VHRGANQRGAGTLETVLVMPLVLLLITTVVQFALWYHASHVALAAAQDGVRAARVEGATGADGRARAQTELDQLGRDLVLSPQITATRGPDVATVEVSGWAPQVVPLLRLPIHQHATSPVERFYAPTQQVGTGGATTGTGP
jgi:Flp pilus assembly protein TadG